MLAEINFHLPFISERQSIPRTLGLTMVMDKGLSLQEIENTITAAVPAERVLWEAPLKSQQALFISYLGSSVNLGNFTPDEVIAFETLRMGLRGDTFLQFLPKSLKQ